MGFGRPQAFITTRSSNMHLTQHIVRTLGVTAAVSAIMGLAACAGMTQQEKNTAIGAGVGAIGGSVLTGGSTAGTLGGAAVGGVVGHEVNKK
jgi:osmotically inducible lipoprotein OsmB